MKRNSKNCHNCKNLDYYEKDGYEDWSDEGYFCQKRNYDNQSQESKHLQQLQRESYRSVPKKCCDIEVRTSCNEESETL